jgi:hypothetical protein
LNRNVPIQCFETHQCVCLWGVGASLYVFTPPPNKHCICKDS